MHPPPGAVAAAGWMITVYGLGVVVGAPTIAALTARTPRRRLVLGLVVLSLGGNVGCALAPTFELVLAGRFVAGLAHVTMVMADLPNPRPTHVQIRGQYDKNGEQVKPGVPASLPPMPKDAPSNRLGLARWLTDPAHPLTARVAVNRFWQQYFGRGIVKTSEDFGIQGEWPTHPDLLDWLAVEFVESGWDIKHIQKLIVTSATYRQASDVTPELLKRDPENALVARGPRYRLDAEVVRDTALFVSGLLTEQIGGRSVKPYQPAGIWEAIGFGGSNTREFSATSGQPFIAAACTRSGSAPPHRPE